LAAALTSAGVRVWLDDQELKIGDSLSAKIDEGRSASRYGGNTQPCIHSKTLAEEGAYLVYALL
jgi:hypothetical protein